MWSSVVVATIEPQNQPTLVHAVGVDTTQWNPIVYEYGIQKVLYARFACKAMT